MSGDDFTSDSTGGANLDTSTGDGTEKDEINDAGDGDSSYGKHLLLFVPDFTNTLDGTATADGRYGNKSDTTMNSYLRLGSADSRAGNAGEAGLGEDLAAMVQGFTDDFRDRGDPAYSQAPHTAEQAETFGQSPFGPQPAPDKGQTYRQSETWSTKFDWLHKKGGWRDHSDGNRITTTRGDKVEVIRGNYKLLVLGRTDEIENAVGFDMSGGQVDTDPSDLGRPNAGDLASQSAAGLNVTWQWAKDGDGNYRWHVTTLQGNADPSGPGAVNDQPNTSTSPSMTTTSWAYDFTSTTTAHTYTTTVTTDQDNVTTFTSNNGNIVSTNTGCNVTTTNNATGSGVVTSTTNAHGIVNTNVANLNIFNETRSPLQESLQQIATNVVFNLVAAQVAIDAGAGLFYGQFSSIYLVNEQAAAMIVNAQQASDIFNTTAVLFTCVNTMVGIFEDTHAGIHVDNHPGVHVDNHAGVHVDLHEGFHIQSSDVHMGSTTAAAVESWLGTRAHMSAQLTDLIESTKFELVGVCKAVL